MQACNWTSWASICALIAPCISRSQAENQVPAGWSTPSIRTPGRCYKVDYICCPAGRHDGASAGRLARACALSPNSLHLVSGDNLTLVRRWEDRAGTLESRCGLRLVGVDALEDDVVAGGE